MVCSASQTYFSAHKTDSREVYDGGKKEYKTMAGRFGTIVLGILLLIPEISWAAQTPIVGGVVRPPIAMVPRVGFSWNSPIIIGPQNYPFYTPFAQYPYFAPAPFNSTPIYYSESTYVTPPLIESPVV